MTMVTEPSAAVVVKALTETQARKLTERIRKSTEELWKLVGEAHDGRAWEPLGYASWDAYVAAEFDISRAQSYRLLDQAHVTHELEAAAAPTSRARDTDDPPVVVDISARAAADIKPQLAEVAKKVADKVRGKPVAKRAAIVDEVVTEARTPAPAAKRAAPAPPRTAPEAQEGGEGLAEYLRAILAVRPAVAARQLSVTDAQFTALGEWLQRVRAARSGGQGPQQQRSREVQSFPKAGKK